MKRPVYICLFLAFLSVASVFAQKVEMILTERLEKQIERLLEKRSEAERVAREVEYVELTTEPDFMKTFVDATRFPDRF